MKVKGPSVIAKSTKISRSNLKRWKAAAVKPERFEGNKKRNNLDGAERHESIPDSEALVGYMTKMRANERALTCTHLVNFLKKHHRPWLDDYLNEKKDSNKPGKEYQTLLMLLRVMDHASRSRPILQAHDGFGPHTIINVEIGMHYDMPPHAIWTVRGGSSKISSGEKHSYRMTAVLSIRADGAKLPILFIMRGVPGGVIDKTELKTFPPGHFYAVQERAWMDARVWAFYLRSLVKPQIDEPSVLLLDNFDPHVSDEARRLRSQLPLDACIMGPFKKHLRDIWLQEDHIEGDDEEEDGDQDLVCVSSQKKRAAMIKRAITAWDRRDSPAASEASRE
ncbi:Aste57867_13059 [Aphanomyces stellatus]|uniref:Aste57867_13059 protein n=1 Tax=Aphanomyces stellatus TaxID=120398 RepID=A0A485KZ96_9STRA|nr:hypothetical protein As57867_013011 [Aphanomyces stellatus]VFT89904.1 Aste57867_13059 [Aphanomyces stellatus]